jgi:hypothetical protein
VEAASMRANGRHLHIELLTCGTTLFHVSFPDNQGGEKCHRSR